MFYRAAALLPPAAAIKLRYISSMSRSRGLPLSLDALHARIDFSVFDPLWLAWFCTRLPGGAPYSVVPAELCKEFDGSIIFVTCLFGV